VVQFVFVGTTTAIARRYAGVAGLALGVAYAGPASEWRWLCPSPQA